MQFLWVIATCVLTMVVASTEDPILLEGTVVSAMMQLPANVQQVEISLHDESTVVVQNVTHLINDSQHVRWYVQVHAER